MDKTEATSKPALSFWEIWNMSFGFMGIQFGFALQNANVSRIFETLGASVDDIPILWIAAPVTGLVVQPIIGYLSDKTWNRLGRRRPYFLVGAILASVALVIMPNSPALWIAAGMLWIMDASINISMEPFRAFVGDMLPDYQRTKGFAMQSFFIGTGAVIASLLPYIMTNWIGLPNTAGAGEIPLSVQWSFYIGAIAFLGAVLWTVFRTGEYPPEMMERFEEKGNTEAAIRPDTNEVQNSGARKLYAGIIALIAGAGLTAIFMGEGYEKELLIFSCGLLALGVLLVFAGYLQKSGYEEHGLVEVMTDFIGMPKTMVQLSMVQFFSWFALFSLWIYTTSAVTAHIYGTTDTTSALYNEGADWVGVAFGVYNGFAAIVAFALPTLAQWTSRKVVHAFSLFIGGLSLVSIYFVSHPYVLLIPMLGVGLAWASILAMPYAILSSAIPAHKMGVYMGIFNFFVVLPQIIAASILGFLVQNYFGGEAIYALIIGGITLTIASIMMLFVEDDADKSVPLS
ncbi:MFS transporter [Fodinibius salsisoli]|uniref:MFS transporter n=1 Tax=Fodinibius salsisoli TaxID=2820877 RepID=A0ABT3PMM1_9BACT|nr:MFS transporter [Fodinibius salsisoli]MCW9707157.1 MFS transporter [Fodinibius salsisoli]